MNKLYSSVFDDAAARFKEQLLQELNSAEFAWTKLISLILEEGSPLQDLLTPKTLQLASLLDAAGRVYQTAAELEELDDGQSKTD